MEINQEQSTSIQLGELLEGAEAHKQELQESLSKLIEDFFGEVLNLVEVAIPFEPSKNGQKSENEVTYQILRSKILRAGNDKIRKLPDILKYFFIKKVMEKKLEMTFNFKRTGGE